MQTLLSQLNTVPGVVGSMVCDAKGEVVAQAFPSLFDSAMLAEAAQVLADSVAGLELVTGALRLVDFRFGDARVVVRPLPGAFLLFLCSSSIDLQPLAISTSVAVPKIERLLANRPEPGSFGVAGTSALRASGQGLASVASSAPPKMAQAAPAPTAGPAPGASELFLTVQRIDAVIERRHLDRFKVRGEIAIKSGFGLGLIDSETPDDPDRTAKLKAAAHKILGEPV
jgi:predicted regulator of Ras-like GTPase activity (Roadblock/LC7/MglB family)